MLLRQARGILTENSLSGRCFPHTGRISVNLQVVARVRKIEALIYEREVWNNITFSSIA